MLPCRENILRKAITPDIKKNLHILPLKFITSSLLLPFIQNKHMDLVRSPGIVIVTYNGFLLIY